MVADDSRGIRVNIKTVDGESFLVDGIYTHDMPSNTIAAWTDLKSYIHTVSGLSQTITAGQILNVSVEDYLEFGNGTQLPFTNFDFSNITVTIVMEMD